MTEPKPTEALLPCPFCGGQAELHDNDWCNPPEWNVYCSVCSARTPGDMDKALAAATWNRRAAARSPAPEWLPIDQAPKDGTVILLDDGHQVTAGYYRGDDETPWALFDKDEPTGILTEPESMIIGWQHLPASSE